MSASWYNSPRPSNVASLVDEPQRVVSVFVQLSSWHIFYGNFLEIRAGAGGPVCFLLTWPPFFPSADTQDFFLSAWGGGGGGVWGGGAATRA